MGDKQQATWRVEPVLFRRRGSAHVVLAHPWRPVGDAIPVEWRPLEKKKSRKLEGRLPLGLRRGRAISLDLELSTEQAESCELHLGGEPVALYEYRRTDHSVTRMSARFLLERRHEVELRCPQARLLSTPPRLEVWRWNPPPPPKPASNASS